MPDEPDRAGEMPAGPMASPLGAPQMALPAPRTETASEHEGSIGPSSSLTRAAGQPVTQRDSLVSTKTPEPAAPLTDHALVPALYIRSTEGRNSSCRSYDLRCVTDVKYMFEPHEEVGYLGRHTCSLARISGFRYGLLARHQ